MLLFNRDDCCGVRLNNFIITVGNNADGKGNSICVADGGDVSGSYDIARYCSSPLTGRYLHVVLKGEKKMLTLCEVHVYAEKIGNCLRPILFRIG